MQRHEAVTVEITYVVLSTLALAGVGLLLVGVLTWVLDLHRGAGQDAALALLASWTLATAIRAIVLLGQDARRRWRPEQ